MHHPVRLAFTSILALALIVSMAMAEVPELVNYQGRLTDATGNPLDTTISITFTIYDDSTGSGSVWTETHDSVIVINGLFDVVLGAAAAGSVPDTVFSDPERYLGIQVGGDPELSPRTRMVSVGYAMQANKADTATFAISGPAAGGGWTDAGTTVGLTTETDNVVIGETTPATAGTKLEIRGHAGLDTSLTRIYFNTTYPWELTYPAFEIYNPSYDYIPFQILGGGVIVQNFPSKKGLRAGTIGNFIGPDSSYFGSKVGIGISSPQSLLHVAGTDSRPLIYSENGGMGEGVRVSSSSGTGIRVENAGMYGLQINNSNDNAIEIGNTSNNGIHIGHADNDGIHVEEAFGKAGYFNGQAYFGGEVGIGVTDPVEMLQIGEGRLLMGNPNYQRNALQSGDIIFDNGETDLPGLKFYYGDYKNFGIDLNDDGGGGLRFTEDLDESSDQTRMIIKEGGNVGIGTLNPAAKLEVAGVVHSTTGGFRFPDGTIQTSASTADALHGSGGTGFIPRFSGPSTVSSSEIFEDDDGHVGIGTTAPQGALDVQSSTGAFIVPRMTSSQRDALPAVNGMIIYNISTNKFNFFENGTWITRTE
jgi:hypothetical protein